MKKFTLLLSGFFLGFSIFVSAHAQDLENEGAFGLKLGGPELMCQDPLDSIAQGELGIFKVGSQHQNLRELAFDIVRATDRQVSWCGLYYVHPYTSGLPYPQTSADSAIINRYWRLLAYFDFDRRLFWDNYVYKNPNGTYPHAVSVSEDRLVVQNPYQGRFAEVRQTSVNDVLVNEYFCGGQVVTEAEFSICVERNFVDLIARQLCRFAL